MAEYIAPHDIEAEKAVLGSMLLDEVALGLSIEKLKANDFYDEKHKAIFNALKQLYDDSSTVTVDLVILASFMETKGALEGVGGDSYLASLSDSVVAPSNVEGYIKIVKQKSTLRNLSEIGKMMHQDAALEKDTAEEVLNKAEAAIMHVGQGSFSGSLEHIKDVLAGSYQDILDATERKGALIGLSTGFGELDRMTLGLQGSQLIVIGARPGDGKTSLALNIASHVAIKENKPVAIFNLEMSAEQLVKRIICSEAMVDLKRASEGSLSDDDLEKVNEAVRTLAAAPIYIDDATEITISSIRSKCRRLKMQSGLSLIVIDYLQLLNSTTKHESRQIEVAALTRALKILAKELDVPILVLSQLRRVPEKKHTPNLSDLRESGAIEQDADTVILIHRYTDDETEMEKAEFIIAKQRSGPTGTIEVCWRGELTKFTSMD
ncbi:MAG: replicative DNA helicase [Clostridia bacterium]|nr:replicative DNA helicase [Clostridia bacterium]